MLEARCGAAGPAPAGPPRSSSSPGSRSTSAYVGWSRVRRCATSRRATPARRSWPPTPARRARRPRGRSWSRPRRPPGCPSAAATPARGRAAPCARSPWRAGAVRVAVHVQRPALQVRQRDRGDPGGVAQQLALGHRRVAAGNSTLSRLVTRAARPKTSHVPCVRPAPPARRSRSSGSGSGTQRRRRPRRPAGRAPQPVRVGQHLVVGAAAEHRPRVVLGVPAVHGVLVALVQQQPLLLAAASSCRGAPAPTGRAASRRAPRRAARPPRHGRARVVGLDRLPGAGVPDDDVAAAVLAGRDHALEVEVLDRVVLDVHRRAACPPGRGSGPWAPPSSPARRRSRTAGRSAAGGPGAAARRTGGACGSAMAPAGSGVRWKSRLRR